MMDPETGLCAGCARTLEEIGNWSRYSEEEKEEIYKQLAIRKKEE